MTEGLGEGGFSHSVSTSRSGFVNSLFQAEGMREGGEMIEI